MMMMTMMTMIVMKEIMTIAIMIMTGFGNQIVPYIS